MKTIEVKTPCLDYENSYETSIIYVYSDRELEKLHTKKLLDILSGIRAEKSIRRRNIGRRCCEYCNDYIGPDWNVEVKPHLVVCTEYIDRIKAILKTRPHIPNKKEAKVIRQEKAKAKRNR